MLQALDNFEGLALEALDGDIGRVDDFHFDEERWTIRYLVVRTEPCLGRHVLISPISLGQPDWVTDRHQQLDRRHVRVGAHGSDPRIRLGRWPVERQSHDEPDSKHAAR
jgi:hypothetical protein